MELERVKLRAEELIKQIDGKGLASIFEAYDKNDTEANYLKYKILSQLHIFNVHGQRYRDDVVKSYVHAEKNREKILATQQELKEFECLLNMNKNHGTDFYKIAGFYYYEQMIKFLSAIDDEYLLSFTKEFGATLPDKKPKIWDKEEREKYKEQVEKVKYQQKEIKELKKKIVSLLETVKTEYSKINIDELITKYPQESEIIKRYVNSSANVKLSTIEKYQKDGKIVHYIDRQSFNYKFLEDLVLRNVSSELIYDAKEGLKSAKDAESLSKTILKLYSLNNNIDLETFISSIRKRFLKNEDLEFRKQNFNGGGLNNADWSETLLNHKEISEKYKKLLDNIKNIDWDSLSEDEILKTIAKISLEFVYIHPFVDGNGRTSRLLMDYLLISNDIIPPVYSVGIDSKIAYNKLIHKAIKNKDSSLFEDWLVKLYDEQIKSKETLKSY